jgi:hypothetical protein
MRRSYFYCPNRKVKQQNRDICYITWMATRKVHFPVVPPNNASQEHLWIDIRVEPSYRVNSLRIEAAYGRGLFFRCCDEASKVFI